MSDSQAEDYANFCAGQADGPEGAYEQERMLHDVIEAAVADLYGRLHEIGYPVCGTVGAFRVGAAVFEWVRQTGRGDIEACIELGRLDAAAALERQSSVTEPSGRFHEAARTRQ